MKEEPAAKKIHVTGVVQGVGFRPFVYNLADRHGLAGWVCNTSSGVDIEVEGRADALASFVAALRSEAPPLSVIDSLEVADMPVAGFTAFEIRHSLPRAGEFQPISPDICICPDCLRELFDPGDRRHRYPFINCTNCGPRFTIIKNIPYDRSETTMSVFQMCPDCSREYDDPLDRRFHAQPNACPVCGPRVGLQVVNRRFDHYAKPDGAIEGARELLKAGAILAVKGLGGFHVACDATDDDAIAELRRRKGRVDKPFALMAFDMGAIEAQCFVGEEERKLLQTRERPILLLRRRPESTVSELAAPGNGYLGFMLPYTPLHYLLLEPKEGFPPALVMTSGNFSEEPITYRDEDASVHLPQLVDAFLTHDREIHVPCDDSVVRVFEGRELPIRRSRGYAPFPVRLPFVTRPVLAVGGELKNTFCAARGDYAFLSQHIGDMQNYETLRSFERNARHFLDLFRIEPEVVACDMHPAYLSTRWARENVPPGAKLVHVQHHHAHTASCMAENRLDGPVIGVSFDGTGYGTDGTIWGGEFLVADYASFSRAAHLKYVPLPGGDAAIRRPYRTALAFLRAAGVDWSGELPPVAACSAQERRAILHQVETGLNSAPTSSMGRLFDAVASIAGVRQTITYEAQGAIELENLAADDPSQVYEGAFEMTRGEDGHIIIDPAPLIRAVAGDFRAGVGVPFISAWFHNSVALMARDVCEMIRAETALSRVVLSGGVFQNVTLLGRARRLLLEAGFEVYTHRLVPPNDGGIALGQAAIAAHAPGRTSPGGET